MGMMFQTKDTLIRPNWKEVGIWIGMLLIIISTVVLVWIGDSNLYIGAQNAELP